MPSTKNAVKAIRIALVWRGDPRAVPLQFPRLQPICDELVRLDVTPVPVAFSEESVSEARSNLLTCDGVLAWVDPLTDGIDRTQFDGLLREVASAGVYISAHPDVILKMGVKEVLVRTKTLGWGTDTHTYSSIEAFYAAFPQRLAADRIRVLKQNRGNSNQGVWKVELAQGSENVGADTCVVVLEARSDVPESGVRLGDFMSRCEQYLGGDGRIIDQAFQPRVGEGLVRCYMSLAKVVGFSEQFPRNRTLKNTSLPSFGMARDKTMHDENAAHFQVLRDRLEADWIPGLQSLLAIRTEELPVLWDADFLYGPKTAEGDDSFVLCEINVSCVTPYPLTAAAAIARAAKQQTDERGRR